MQDLPTKKQAKVKRDFCIQNSVALHVVSYMHSGRSRLFKQFKFHLFGTKRIKFFVKIQETFRLLHIPDFGGTIILQTKSSLLPKRLLQVNTKSAAQLFVQSNCVSFKSTHAYACRTSCVKS